jgi:hypothetical protein
MTDREDELSYLDRNDELIRKTWKDRRGMLSGMVGFGKRDAEAATTVKHGP